MTPAVITPLYTPPDANSGLVVMNTHHDGCMAVRALSEATLAYENRLEWRGWERPSDIHLIGKKGIITFGDKTFFGIAKLGTSLVVFPAALGLAKAEASPDHIATLVKPYLEPHLWRSAIHHPTHKESSIRALSQEKAFLPFWARATLFDWRHADSLKSLLWIMGNTLKLNTRNKDPFTLTLMGVAADNKGLFGPTILLSQSGSGENSQWRHWMAQILLAWMNTTFGKNWRLHCIHQYPKGRQGVLAQVEFPGPHESGHNLFIAQKFINSLNLPHPV